MPKKFTAFMVRYGANVAGPIWLLGSILQFTIGVAVTVSTREIVSSVLNIASPLSYLFFGHKNGGVALGCLLGLIGTFLAVYPGLIDGEFGTVFGMTAFVISISAGIFSKRLTDKFSASPSGLLRLSLGHPRRMMGWIALLLCRLPIIYAGLAHGRGLAYVAPFAVWGLGDLAVSLSRANLEE